MQQAGILSGFVLQEEFAASVKVATRTIARYRREPDGLPFMKLGGKIYIPIADAKVWLEAKVVRPNPRRSV